MLHSSAALFLSTGCAASCTGVEVVEVVVFLLSVFFLATFYIYLCGIKMIDLVS